MENVTILRRIFSVFGITLLVTSILIYLYRGSFEKFNENSKMLMHTMNMQEKTELLFGLIKDTESGTRGYVITDDPDFLEPFTYAQRNIKRELAELKTLTQNNPKLFKTLDSMEVLINRKLAFQNFMIHLKKTGNFKFGQKELLLESKSLMDSIRILTHNLKAEQNKIQIIRDLEVKEATNYSRVLSTIFSITAITIMICSLVYILWEIRSKKKVKNLLNAVLESSQSGIMSFKAIRNIEEEIIDFDFVQINKIGTEMLDFPQKALIGKSLFYGLQGKDAIELFGEFSKVINENIIYKTEKLFIKEGIKTWYRIIAVKLDDGVTVTFDDVSKEKGYEEELKNFISDLKRSNSELEQFAFVASHDLQEPLRKIQTFGDRLKITSKETLKGNSVVYIDKMLSAAARMSSLINDLLSYSRLARTNYTEIKTDLNTVIADVLNDLEITIQNKKAVINYEKLPVLDGIPTQLYQLFFNLIGNALKFSREGVSPEITIQVERISKVPEEKTGKSDSYQQPFVRITVSDNGIGFENQYADRIFEVFQRLNARNEFEGTGIGLAICNRIVSNHRGFISASGELNKGSKFIVDLPINKIA